MKKKILCWSDSVTASTGFATVAKHVLRGLYDTGKYEIDQLAINYNGEFFDKNVYPYQLSAARLTDPKDPYGNRMFLQAIASGDYDFVWIMNDTFVVHKIADELNKLREQMRTAKKKVPKVIFYYPVDCKVMPEFAGMLEASDWNVAYCNFGLEETKKALPHLLDKTSIITHGVDISTFTQLPEKIRQDLRMKYFKISDPNTMLFINVNRNSIRKQMAHTILAFNEYKKNVNSNSKLYLHTAPQDTTIDLYAAVEDLGLSKTTDVIFPKNYAAHKPFPVQLLNGLYNCADAYITTTLGEGWGLTHIEAMACGVPVICPQNTTFPEQLHNGERGYMYQCRDLWYVDNSGYRKSGRIEDIVMQMKLASNDKYTGNNKSRITAGLEYANSLNWKKIVPQWIELFDMVEKLDTRKNIVSEVL